MTMENQHCKVGAITRITGEQWAIKLLEYQYQNFIEKAKDIRYANTKLGEFFEHKAQKIKKILENLVS